MVENQEIHTHVATVKRGHYGLLDPHTKIEILKGLVGYALDTGYVKELLDEHIEQRQELGALRRGEAIEEAKKIRKQKERSKAESDSNGVTQANGSKDLEKTQKMENGNQSVESEETESEKRKHSSKKGYFFFRIKASILYEVEF